MVKRALRGRIPINMMKKFLKVPLPVSLLLLAACGPADKPVIPPDVPVKVVAAPPFNADSAYSYVEKQVAFGPRVPNTKAHVDCKNYLVAKLQQFTDTVIVQTGQVMTYDNRKLNIFNIIGRLYPKAETRVMLFSHWDSRSVADQDTERKNEPILGANDGASGVGILLEMARIIHEKNPGIGVDIMFFDAEDQGEATGQYQDSYCLGTQYWAKNQPIPFYKPQYGILLDMVGGKNAKFYREGGSAGFVLEKVWGRAAQLGYADYFVNSERSAIIDDHYYVINMTGIPCIDIIQYEEGSNSRFPYYWHTHKDDMSAVDKNTLKVVGQTLLDVVYNENPL